MNLTEYTRQVNALAKAECDRLNAEYRAGRLLFGASCSVFPESMLAYYQGQGFTPEQCLDEIHAGAGN